MATKPDPNAHPLSPDTNSSTTMITATPTDPSSPYPSKPPAALTIILSIACGLVATCILLTVRLEQPSPLSPMFHPHNRVTDRRFAPPPPLFQTSIQTRTAAAAACTPCLLRLQPRTQLQVPRRHAGGRWIRRIHQRARRRPGGPRGPDVPSRPLARQLPPFCSALPRVSKGRPSRFRLLPHGHGHDDDTSVHPHRLIPSLPFSLFSLSLTAPTVSTAQRTISFSAGSPS